MFYFLSVHLARGKCMAQYFFKLKRLVTFTSHSNNLITSFEEVNEKYYDENCTYIIVLC